MTARDVMWNMSSCCSSTATCWWNSEMSPDLGERFHLSRERKSTARFKDITLFSGRAIKTNTPASFTVNRHSARQQNGHFESDLFSISYSVFVGLVFLPSPVSSHFTLVTGLKVLNVVCWTFYCFFVGECNFSVFSNLIYLIHQNRADKSIIVFTWLLLFEHFSHRPVCPSVRLSVCRHLI